MTLTNCENTLDLNWSGNCVKVATNVADPVPIFSITDTKILEFSKNNDLFRNTKPALTKFIKFSENFFTWFL